VPHKRKPQPIPSVFTKPEIEKFLSSFDRESNMGKRDYAIALLALRLGIRSSDIRNLKIGDIDFNVKTINFIQRKTQTPQRLELLPEIDTAIRAYLTDARQECHLQNLFLTVRSPIRQISRQLIRDIISHHLDASGINVGNRKRGPHSLRRTLASELVSENVPYDAVRKILGHEDPNSIKHYVKFDIEGLRPCAIDVPPLTGKFSDFIYAGRGGV
jgi:integrase